MTGKLPWNIRWRLSVLWALEWGVTGAILTYLPLYFTENRLDVVQLGQLMAVSAVGLWVAPLVVGQICDRWMSTDRYLAIAHLVGGLTLVAIPWATEQHRETGEGFTFLLALVGLYAVAYFPTIPLASSLSFRHLPDPDAQFGKVRIWGTGGWVLAGWTLSLWLGRSETYEYLSAQHPDFAEALADVVAVLPPLPTPESADSFRLAAGLSFVLSAFCLMLPATPPDRERITVAPLKVAHMIRTRPTFAVLIAVSFVLAMVVPFYALAVPKLVEKMLAERNLGSHWVPAVMTVGQLSEFPALILLSLCLKKLGLKTTFALGMAAWLVRYGMFSFEGPPELILTAIALHGVCHVFLIIVVQLYVDSQCSRDVQASAQNVFAFVTMGIAMPIGFLLAGLLGQLAGIGDADTGNFQLFFSAPAAVVLVLLAAYWKWFRLPADGKRRKGKGKRDRSSRV